MNKTPADYSVLKVEIDGVNLTPYFSGATFHESVFSHHLMGSAGFEVYTDLYNTGITTGSEFVIIYKSIDRAEKELKFIVTDIVENERTNKTISLNVSLIGENGLAFKTQQSFYANGSIAKIVDSVYNRFNKTDKALEVINTAWQFSFVFPNWSCDRILDFLASKANSSETEKSNFVFYETKTKYKFDCLNDVISREPFREYSPMPDTGQLNNSVNLYKDFRIIEKYDLDNAVDNGMIKNRVYVLDPYNKEYKKGVSESEKDFDVPHVSIFKYHHNRKFNNVSNSHVLDYVGKKLIDRYESIETIAEFEVSGDVDLECGNCVNLNVVVGDNPSVDRKLSGKWVIIDVIDSLADAYTQTVRVARFIK